MSDSQRDTNLQKGARVVNAAIAELGLPDELKTSAQQIVSMFATDLLPGFWPRREAGPASAPSPDPREASSAEEAEILARLRLVVRSVVDDDDETPPSRPSQAGSDEQSIYRGNPPERTRTWDARERKLVEVALVTLRCAYQTQLAQLEGAIHAASNRGVDALDVLDLLLGAQDYRSADPVLSAVLALPPAGAKSDLH